MERRRNLIISGRSRPVVGYFRDGQPVVDRFDSASSHIHYPTDPVSTAEEYLGWLAARYAWLDENLRRKKRMQSDVEKWVEYRQRILVNILVIPTTVCYNINEGLVDDRPLAHFRIRHRRQNPSSL